MTNHLEWINSIDLLTILWLILQYKLQAYCIVQPLLINNILNLDLLTCLSSHQLAVILRYYVDTIQRSATLSFQSAISLAKALSLALNFLKRAASLL